MIGVLYCTAPPVKALLLQAALAQDFNLPCENKIMNITSAAFANGERVPKKYTCEGPNISPPLSFTDVPSEAKSLVLLVEDPDAPARPWVHWHVYNIPPQCGGFEEGQIANGAQQGLCNGNTFGYEGPCPPENEHEYLFKLYALDVVLDVPANESVRKNILEKIRGHVIAEALLKGKYQKESFDYAQDFAR